MRCFIAIELPVDVHRKLAGLQRHLSPLEPDVRWMPVETIHLTLKFLGEVPDPQVPEVCAAALEVATHIPPFELEVCGVGCYSPSGAPRVLWAGITRPVPPPLLACQKALEAACTPLGFAPEGRAYSPHLTIGRVRERGATGRIRPAVRAQEAFTAGAFTVSELTVFQSILGQPHARHIPLARAPLLAAR